jgi:hypothetical protein
VLFIGKNLFPANSNTVVILNCFKFKLQSVKRKPLDMKHHAFITRETHISFIKRTMKSWQVKSMLYTLKP